MMLAEFDSIDSGRVIMAIFLILAELYWSSLSKEAQFLTGMMGNAFTI